MCFHHFFRDESKTGSRFFQCLDVLAGLLVEASTWTQDPVSTRFCWSDAGTFEAEKRASGGATGGDGDSASFAVSSSWCFPCGPSWPCATSRSDRATSFPDAWKDPRQKRTFLWTWREVTIDNPDWSTDMIRYDTCTNIYCNLCLLCKYYRWSKWEKFKQKSLKLFTSLLRE